MAYLQRFFNRGVQPARAMQSVEVRLTRVFDVQRIPASRFSGKHTLFSFEAPGLQKYSVQASGWPRLEAGDTLVMLLKKPSNWQSLEGWLNLVPGHPLWSPFWALTFAAILVGNTWSLRSSLRVRQRLERLSSTAGRA